MNATLSYVYLFIIKNQNMHILGNVCIKQLGGGGCSGIENEFYNA